jgi:hypothetical protein
MQRHRQLEWNAVKTDGKDGMKGAKTDVERVRNGARTGAQAALSPRLLLLLAVAARIAVLQGAVLVSSSSI